jgi:hypothetical protein
MISQMMSPIWTARVNGLGAWLQPETGYAIRKISAYLEYLINVICPYETGR